MCNSCVKICYLMVPLGDPNAGKTHQYSFKLYNWCCEYLAVKILGEGKVCINHGYYMYTCIGGFFDTVVHSYHALLNPSSAMGEFRHHNIVNILHI